MALALYGQPGHGTAWAEELKIRLNPTYSEAKSMGKDAEGLLAEMESKLEESRSSDDPEFN